MPTISELSVKITADTGQAKKELGSVSDVSKKAASDTASSWGQAFKTLGVTSSASLHKAAQEAISAFALIKNSGQSSARDVEQAYIAMQAKIAAASGQVAGSVKQSASSFQSLSAAAVTSGVVIAQMATSVISKIASIATSAFQTGLEFLKLKEQATTAFTNLLGSGEKANAFLKELAAFAAKTPFEFSELVPAAQKLVAMGFAARDVIPMLTAVGNAVAAMGGSAEQVNRVTTALSQMKAKGKVSAEEMMQLAEAGIPAWKILAESIGKSIPEAMKMAEKGTINADVAIRGLVEGMQKNFGGMMEKQSMTFAGMMSTISDTSQQALGSVLEPLFKQTTSAMQDFVAVLPLIQSGIESMDDSAKIAIVTFGGLTIAAGLAGIALWAAIGGPVGIAVAASVAIMGVAVAGFATAAITNFGQLGSAITSWTGKTTTSFVSIAGAMGAVVDGIAIFARVAIGAFDLVGTAVVILMTAFQGLAAGLSGLGTSIAGIISFDPSQVIAGVNQMSAAWTNFDQGVSTQLRALNQRMKTNIVDSVENASGKFSKSFAKMATDAGSAITKIREDLSKPLIMPDAMFGGGKPGKPGSVTDGKGGADGAKKAAAELAKILKEQLDSVNEWTKETKQALSLNIEVWKMLPVEIRNVLKGTADAFHESINKTKLWAGALQAAFIQAANGDLGKSLIVTVKGTKISIESAAIAVKDAASIDINPNLWAKLLQTEEGKKQLKAIQIAAQELGQTINFVVPQMSEHLVSFADVAKGAGLVTKDVFEDTKHDVKAWADSFEDSMEASTKALQSSEKALKEWGNFIKDAVKGVKDDIKNNVGDGIGGILIALADKFKLNLTKVNNWSGGVMDIIGGLPGKIGDKLRNVTDTITSWANRLDSILKGLHKVFNSIPDGLGGMLQSIIGLFKSKTPAAAKSWDDFLGNLNKSTQKGMSGMLGTLGKAAGAAAGILGGIGTFMGTRNQGKVTGVIGGAMAGMATGAAIGSLFGPGPGTAIGAGIGAAAGAILGLFGSGKSKEQKRAEEEAKQRASLDMQRAAADIMTAQMEGLKKGLELLEGLKTFSEVPRKAIKRFFNEIELILTLFAEMAGKFKAESIEKSKMLTESMGDSFGFLLSGADLINAIKTVASITDANIKDFIDTTMKIIAKWAEAANTIELQAAKFTGKISDKLKTSFEFLQIVPDVIKGFGESTKVDDTQIDSVFASITKIVQKMKELSEAERGLELNKAGASAGIFSTIFESIKMGVEAIKGIVDIGTLGEGAWGAFQSFVNQMVTALSDSVRLMDVASNLAANFKTLADAIRVNVLAGMDSIKSVAGALASLLGGAGGAAASSLTRDSGAPLPIVPGAGIPYIKGSAGTFSKGADAPVLTPSLNLTVNVQGSVISERDLMQAFRDEVNKILNQRSTALRVASIS